MSVLVEGSDGKHFDAFFSFLDLESPLDLHLAGYFEKVAELLFRRMTVPVMMYVNTKGQTLLQSFTKHMDNYSIMQIVQRLLLPHIPFSISESEHVDPMNAQNQQCTWAYSEETCDLLCNRMLELGNIDVPSHISDLMITVLQLSPADSSILANLSRTKSVEPIICAAIVDDADTMSAGDLPTPQQAVSLAAISVLESMILRLGEAAGPFLEDREMSPAEAQAVQQINENLEKVLAVLVSYLPKINAQLVLYARDPKPCGSQLSQSKTSAPRLGHRGLQLVKFVEALVRLSNADFDVHLCESGVIRSSADLIFAYDNNSILHLSIQRIVLMVIEGGPSRRSIKYHLLIECGMLQRIMDRIDRQINEASASNHTNSYPRAPSIGHFIHIVQALHHNFSSENFDVAVAQEQEELIEQLSSVSLHHHQGQAQVGREHDGGASADETSTGHPHHITATSLALASAAEETQSQSQSQSQLQFPNTATLHSATLHSILEAADMLVPWQNFVNHLVQFLEAQSTMPAPAEGDYETMGVSQQMEMAMHALGLQRLQNEMAGGWHNKVNLFSFFYRSPIGITTLASPFLSNYKNPWLTYFIILFPQI